MAAEVVAIIASVAGLSSSLITISTAIANFVGINKEVKSIAVEVDTLYKVNNSLELALASNKARPNSQWLSDTKQVLQGCTATIDELLNRIQGAGSGNKKMSFARKVSWTMKRSDVTLWCSQLRSYSQMLGSLQFSLLHQSNRRQETMQAETLLKVDELKQEFESFLRNSPAVPVVEERRDGEYQYSDNSVPASGSRARGGLSQEAQDAMNSTEYGSTRQPPEYSPKATQWQVQGATFKGGRLGVGTFELGQVNGIHSLVYKPSGMATFEIVWLLGKTTKAKGYKNNVDAKRKWAISIKNVKLGRDSEVRSNLTINCLDYDQHTATEVPAVILSRISLLTKRPSEIKDENEGRKWSILSAVLVVWLIVTLWVSLYDVGMGVLTGMMGGVLGLMACPALDELAYNLGMLD